MDEKLEWDIKVIQGRYRYLKLSAEQALAVHSWEQERILPDLDVEHFSSWEEQDCEWDHWRKILTDSQMKKFEAWQEKNIKRAEEALRESNVKDAKELAFREEWVRWLKEEFVPALHRDAKEAGIRWIMQQEKIRYLRREYKAYLERSRQSLIVQHYRHSRRLRPNSLQVTLLHQEEKQLIPNYVSFMESADEAVRTVAAFLVKKYQILMEGKAEFFQGKATEKLERYKALRKQHFGDEENRKGWVTTIYVKHPLSSEESAWMSYLLMDNPDPAVMGPAV